MKESESLSVVSDSVSPGILQARILQWIAVSFFRGSSNPGIKPRSPGFQADYLSAEPQGSPMWVCAYIYIYIYIIKRPCILSNQNSLNSNLIIEF